MIMRISKMISMIIMRMAVMILYNDESSLTMLNCCRFCLPEFVLPMIKSCLKAPILLLLFYMRDNDDDDDSDDNGVNGDDNSDDNGENGANSDDDDSDDNGVYGDDYSDDNGDNNGDDYRTCTISRTQSMQPQRCQGKICAGDQLMMILRNNDE